MYFETVVAVAITLGLLIYAHEFGHFAACKLLGVRVEEFAFGFWKRLVVLGRRRGTVYTINALPLGGFVKIAGMEPGEESPPDGFNAQSAFRRALIIFAGPFMSLVLACTVFWLIGVTWGYQTGSSKNKVAFVQEGTPAQKMGLRRGDKMVEINHIRVRSGDHMRNLIYKSGGTRLRVVVTRNGGDRVVLYGTPQLEKGSKPKRYLLGFLPEQKLQRTSLAESFKQGSFTAFAMGRALLITLTSKKIKSEVGGPISIGQAIHSDVQLGWYWVILRIGMLSLTIFVVNLFPIPVLDGGHLMLILIEKVRGRRLTKEQFEVVTAVGLAVIAALFVLLLYADVSRLINHTPVQ